MAKPYVIALANQKGGVGKTTSCVNIASCAAAMGLRVLLIDSDPQGNTTSGVGVSKKNITKTTYDVLLDGIDPKDCIVKTEFNNLWVVPSTINLAGAEFELFDIDHRERQMKNFIAKCEDFDLIMIDCPPSLSMLTINALTAADGVIIPMQCEYYALEGLTQLMMTIRKVKELYNPALTVLGILVTMYNGRLNLSMAVLNEIKKYYKDKLFTTMIPRSVKLSEAPGFGEPINYHDKYSKASDSYVQLTKEILGRIGIVPMPL
ncbi:MAG: ParA family protein [Ruminococcaceae bacterium]|nr:ParA family protein [Oscillospiraceae bacterium]